MTSAVPPVGRAKLACAALAAAGLNVLLLCTPAALLAGQFDAFFQPRVLLFLALATSWTLFEAAASARFTQSPLGNGWSRCLPLAIGAALLVTFALALSEAVTAPSAGPRFTILAGSILLATGIALRAIAIRTLGSFFLNEVALLPEQPLVTRGIYGWLRHPSELGSLCLAAGGTLLLGSAWAALAAGLVLLPLVLWRVRREDELLAAAYPQAFARYALQVPGLLPAPRLKQWLTRTPKAS